MVDDKILGTLILGITAIFGPLGGILIDLVAKCLKKNENLSEKSRRVVGSTVVICINIALGFTYYFFL